MKTASELSYEKTHFLNFYGSNKAREFYEPFKMTCSTEDSKFVIWLDRSFSVVYRNATNFSPIQFSLSKQKELKSLIQTFQSKLIDLYLDSNISKQKNAFSVKFSQFIIKGFLFKFEKGFIPIKGKKKLWLNFAKRF